MFYEQNEVFFEIYILVSNFYKILDNKKTKKYIYF